MRLIYFKFQRLYIFAEISVLTVGLISFLIGHYLTLNTGGLSPVGKSLIIYPPLSAPPEISELDLQRLENEKAPTLILIFVIFILLTTLTIITIKQRRKLKS